MIAIRMIRSECGDGEREMTRRDAVDLLDGAELSSLYVLKIS